MKASSKEKTRRVTPEDHFVKLCHDELVELMGPVDNSIKFAKKGPTGIMLVGLQGSGKTTTIGKLARFLERQHRRPLLVAADVYRPAAIETASPLAATSSVLLHVGRLIDAIEDLGVLDDTIVYYIIGDNGASAEGTMNGAFNEMANFNGMAALESPEFLLSKMDEFGSPSSYNHYAVGWAWAMDTPFQWTKQVASHWGGTRNGTIVHWPNGINERGGLRSQFTHVIDIAPTILEAAGLPEPTHGQRRAAVAHGGHEHAVHLQRRRAPERHDLQYFEMFGNRGIYHKGWSAVTKHSTPWIMVGGDLPAFDDDVWELYDGSTDYSQARNLAADNPEMLAKLQRLWLIEATKYNVLPIDDRGAERLDPEDRRSADPDPGELPAVLPRHGSPVREQCREHQEQVVLGHRRDRRPDRGVDGVVIAQGGRFGGWCVYFKDGQGQVRLQRARHPRVRDRSRHGDPEGNHQVRAGVRVRRWWSRQGWNRDALLRRQGIGTGRVEATQPMIFSADETTDIGYESGTTVTPDYDSTRAGSPARSTGCSSISATTTTTTSSIPKNVSASPWRGSDIIRIR